MIKSRAVINIKLLAIISILAIILLVVTPKLLSNYQKIKKERYIVIANDYIKQVKKSLNSLKYKQIPSTNEALLVPIANIKAKKRSPYGVLKEDCSYVVVYYDGNNYDYYISLVDSSNHGIIFVNEKELTVESIVSGYSNFKNITSISNFSHLYIGDILFGLNEVNMVDDKNLLLTPINKEMSVNYDFKEETFHIYDKILNNIDLNIYNKEATINSGIIKYNGVSLKDRYSDDLNGLFRYISFVEDDNEDKLNYYSSFVLFNNSYVAGIINKEKKHENENIIFDSVPAIVLQNEPDVTKNNQKRNIMWNAMAIYPDNKNYTITECGILAIRNNNSNEIELSHDTSGVMVGKSKNNCERGNVFAVRKRDVNSSDKWFARGYLKYKDKSGKEHIVYSLNTSFMLIK